MLFWGVCLIGRSWRTLKTNQITPTCLILLSSDVMPQWKYVTMRLGWRYLWMLFGFVCSCSPTSIDWMYTTKKTCVVSAKPTMKHQQNWVESRTSLWFSYGYQKLHACWFLNWTHRSCQSTSVFRVEHSTQCEDVVQSHPHICLYGVCFFLSSPDM